MTSSPPEVLRYLREHGAARARDLERLGLSRTAVTRLVRKGELIRVSRGLYEAPDVPATEHHGLVLAQLAVEHGTIALLSALQFHGLTTQAPFEVWMLIDSLARVPKVDYPPLRTVQARRAALEYGVKAHRLEGVTVRITGAAKTVADCFRYRRVVGLDVAIEALRDYRRSGGSVRELWAAAAVTRVTSVIRPYLEALG